MRGLRYILNVDHSYYSHITNEEVIEQANLAINKCADQEITWAQFKADRKTKNVKEVTLVGDVILMRQEHLLRHLIRHPQNLMTKVCLTDDLQRRQQLYKRAGMPRLDWTVDNLHRICNNTHHENNSSGDQDQGAALKRDALSHMF